MLYLCVTAVYVVSQGKKDAPVVFGQLTKRDGSLLIGRSAQPNFKWTDMAGKEVIGGRPGGMPAMSLQYAMEQNGLKLGKNTSKGEAYLNLDVAFDMVVSAFEGGTGDYCTMFEPLASDYVAKGKGYIVADVGSASGEIPFTAFMTSSKYLNKNNDKLVKFLKAVQKGYTFVTTADIEDVVTSLTKSFPGVSRESIKSSIESYKNIDAWCSSPVMTEESFNRMQTVMSNAGFLQTKASYSKVVNNTIATQVAA